MGDAVMLFEFREVSPGRWWCRNTTNDVVHHTYGTREEVEAALLRASASIAKRAAGDTSGRGWKSTRDRALARKNGKAA